MRVPGTPAQPPGWDGEPRGEPGIHGLARARRWDAVAATPAPEIPGDEVAFVVLPDGSVLPRGADVPAAALAPLVAALALEPPYRADAVRRDARHWAAAAVRIHVAELPGLDGEEVELVVAGGEHSARVDGMPWLARLPQLEALARGDAVVRARRLRGSLWEVEVAPL